MGRLENNFTWSSSRDGTFQRCTRQYWWQYYGSWGGWERDGDPEAREAYILKNLTTRWAWVGSAVHESIEGILKSHQAASGPAGELAFGRPRALAVDEGKVLDALTERMRREWAASRDQAYRRRPKQVLGLMEHEYGDAVPREEWAAMHDKAREALRGWLQSAVFERIRESDPRCWLPIEQMDKFDFEGTPVWAVLDFGMHTEDGGAEIYDWKTGAVDPQGNRAQLVCYALYVRERFGVPTERVTTRLVYLGSRVEVHDVRVAQPDLDEVAGQVRASIAAMRERLSDAAANIARREDFPMTDDLEACRTCAYRRFCKR
ncbi:MAG: PD-(D/E)XK nuclease family protein [Planctomycetia bacterium]